MRKVLFRNPDYMFTFLRMRKQLEKSEADTGNRLIISLKAEKCIGIEGSSIGQETGMADEKSFSSVLAKDLDLYRDRVSKGCARKCTSLILYLAQQEKERSKCYGSCNICSI